MTLGVRGSTIVRWIFVSISLCSILLSTQQLGSINGPSSSSSIAASLEWADPSQWITNPISGGSPETNHHTTDDEFVQTNNTHDKKRIFTTEGGSPKPRILVGVFSRLNDVEERQRRHLIRHTYLRFDLDHSPTLEQESAKIGNLGTSVNTTTIRNRMCSLAEFQQRHRNLLYNDADDACQLVYVFVMEVVDTEESAPNISSNATALGVVVNNASDYFSSSSSPSTNYPNDDCLDDDMVFVQFSASKTTLEEDLPFRLRPELIASWYQHFLHGPPSTLPIDNIAYTDTKVAILPSLFWNKNRIFRRNLTKKVPHLDSPSFRYAGIQVPKSKCQSSTCPSLQAEYVMRRWVCLSRSLVKNVQELLLEFQPAKSTVVMVSAKRKRPESVDIMIANLVHRVVETTQDSLSSSPIRELQAIDLHGIFTNMKSANTRWKASTKFHTISGGSGLLGDYLAFWDRYKDSFTSYRQSPINQVLENKQGDTKRKRPNMLLGIFTMDSDQDASRREMIRKTWISSHETSKSFKRICSLQEWIVNGTGCELAYIFVLGGNPNGTTELLAYNESHPMSIPCQLDHGSEGDTDDIVCLNIRENMEDGKSQTWLKYATTVFEDHGYFDYVGKMDSDTLLYPGIFLKQVLQRLPMYPGNARVYGGDYRFKPPNMVGPVYMGGHLYFVSADLAQFVVSPDCPRSAVDKGIEDVSIGNFVHSHPLPIRRIRLFTNEFDHPVKRVDRYRTLWRKYKARHKQ